MDSVRSNSFLESENSKMNIEISITVHRHFRELVCVGKIKKNDSYLDDDIELDYSNSK